MNLDGYIRVSRVAGRNGEAFISPRAQRDKIEGYAKLHGHRVVEWHEDLDEPGSKASRPGFQAVLERVESGATDAIAVAKLDRFARSVADASAAIHRIEDAGGQLVSVEDNFDSSTAMGRFAMHMLLALGELELARIRENWSQAQAYAVDRGVHIASRAPTGYRRGGDGRLVAVKRDAKVIAEVFRRRAAGASWRELANLLESRGVVGPYKNEHWTTSAVSKVISNRVYVGEARSGRNVKPNAHPAIVSEAGWQAAQSARSLAPARSTDGALLAGLLRCAGCRYVIKPDSMRDRDGERLRLYRCRGEHAAGRCPAKASVLGRVIEPYVVEAFFETLEPGGVLAAATGSRGEIDEARDALEETELELEAWLGLSLAEIGRDLYVQGLQQRQQRVDLARVALNAARALADTAGSLPPLEDLRGRWPTMTTAEQRQILSAGIDAIMLWKGTALDDRVLILWRGQAPADLPRRGQRVPLASFARDDHPVEIGAAAA